MKTSITLIGFIFYHFNLLKIAQNQMEELRYEDRVVSTFQVESLLVLKISV